MIQLFTFMYKEKLKIKVIQKELNVKLSQRYNVPVLMNHLQD